MALMERAFAGLDADVDTEAPLASGIDFCARAGLDRDTVRAFLSGQTDSSSLPEPAWGPIGKVVFERTYARDVPGEDRKETWAETVRRVVLGNLSYVPERLALPAEAEQLFALIYSFSAVPAGRHLWVTGVPVISSMSRNCFVSGFSRHASSHFRFLAARLFEGGGVGANYSYDLLEVTPPIAGSVEVRFVCDESHPDFDRVVDAAGDSLSAGDPTGKTQVITVDDTREGWVDAWCAIIDLACQPGAHRLVLSVSAVRPHGTPLRTFGGRASGPAPFVAASKGIAEVLDGARGRRMNGLEAMAIDHHIASAVVAGGSRRSARLALMRWDDPDIFAFIDCKADQLSHWSANISVEIDAAFRRAVVDGDRHANAVLRKVAEGMIRNGEPGLIDTGLASQTEPVPLRAVNPCLTGDTKLLTRDGLVPIAGLAGKSFQIWNGKEWAPSKAWSTGVKPVYEVRLADGASISATSDHVLATVDGGPLPVSELAGHRISLFTGEGWDGLDSWAYDEALLLGFLQGDGCRREGGGVMVKNSEPEVTRLLEAHGFHQETGGTWYAGTTSPAVALVEKAGMLKDSLPDRQLPEWLFTASRDTVRAFLRGLYSANGAALRNHRRTTLKSTCRELVVQVQQILAAFGMRSYITTNKPSIIEWPNGTYESRESYDLNIANVLGLRRFRDTIGFLHDHKTAALDQACAFSRPGRSKSSRVVSVTYVGEEEVYDFTEPRTHWGWANGMKTHNCGESFLATDDGTFGVADGAGEACNLGSVDLASFGTDITAAAAAVGLVARFLYRSTANPHPDPAAGRIEAVNRRIGVGIMGLQGWVAAHGRRLSELPNCPDLLDELTYLRRSARLAADELADALGTPRSVKVTAVAPTGTIAQLGGTTPGLHPCFARRFIRRVRFSDSDPTWQAEAAKGYRVVDDIYAANTKVVEYPMADTILARWPERLIEQSDEIGPAAFLDMIAAVQASYVGGTDGQAVSATAHVDPSEDPARLVEIITARLGKLKGFTLFPALSRDLAPYEAVDAETYEALRSALDATASTVGDSNDGECEGNSCPIR